MLASVIADGHLCHGVHGLFNTAAFRRACNVVIAEQHDVCIAAGDLFNTGNPPGEAIVEAAKGMRRMAEAGVEVIYVCGNHEWIGVDVSRGHRPASMALNEIPGVTVVDKPELVTLDSGLHLALMPWPAPTVGSEEAHLDSIRRVIDACDGVDEPCLAIAHAAVAETKLRGSELELAALTREWTIPRSEIDVPEVLGHTALGHIHQRIALSPTCGYVGALEAITFADEGQARGFSVLSYEDGEWFEEHEAVGERHFATLQIEGIDQQIERLREGTIVRVEIPDGGSEDDVPLPTILEAGLVYKGTYRPPATQSERAERSVDAEAGDFCPIEHIEIDDDLTLLGHYAERERIDDDDLDDMLYEADMALGWN